MTRELTSEYIDGLLDQARAAQFRAHLDQCPACRRELAAIEKTVLLVRSLKPVEAPSGMVQRIHARLEAAEKPRVSLWPIKISYPVLALAAGLVLLLGFGAYFLLEQGRRQSGFRVASVEHEQAELAGEADKAEAVRSSALKEAVDTRSAEKDGRIWKEADVGKDKMVVQSEIRRFAAGARSGAGEGRHTPSPAASAPSAVAEISAPVSEAPRAKSQVFSAKEGEAPAGDETLMAKAISRTHPAVAPQIPVAGSAALRTRVARTSPVQPVVTLAIATTNRSAVEQILLAFDEKRPSQKGQQADLKATAKAAPALRMNAVSAHDYNRVIAITVSASRWKELLAQLKSHGAVSVAGRDMETDKAPSRAEAEIKADTAAESQNILSVHVTITAP